MKNQTEIGKDGLISRIYHAGADMFSNFRTSRRGFVENMYNEAIESVLKSRRATGIVRYMNQFKTYEGVVKSCKTKLVSTLGELDQHLSAYLTKKDSYLQTRKYLPENIAHIEGELSQNLEDILKYPFANNVIIEHNYDAISSVKERGYI